MIDNSDFNIAFDDLGVPATFTHGGTPATIAVIITETAAIINDVRTQYVTATCKGDDVINWIVNDTLTVSGTTYYIIGEEEGSTPDFPTLQLSKASV